MKPKRRTIEKKKPLSSLWIKGFTSLIGFSFFFFCTVYVGLWIFDPQHFPINSVQLVGSKSYLPESIAKEAVIQQTKYGMLRLSTTTVKKNLLALPWFEKVDVKKIWPNKLVIQFKERYPILRWNQNGLIGSDFTLFYPPIFYDEFFYLPLLKAPENRYQFAVQQYQTMQQRLRPLDISVEEFELANRGSLSISLSNGILLLLGTKDWSERFETFLKYYPSQFSAQVDKIAYIDLRYGHALAIGWKSG